MKMGNVSHQYYKNIRAQFSLTEVMKFAKFKIST